MGHVGRELVQRQVVCKGKWCHLHDMISTKLRIVVHFGVWDMWPQIPPHLFFFFFYSYCYSYSVLCKHFRCLVSYSSCNMSRVAPDLSPGHRHRARISYVQRREEQGVMQQMLWPHIALISILWRKKTLRQQNNCSMFGTSYLPSTLKNYAQVYLGELVITSSTDL